MRTPVYERASFGPAAKTYLNQLIADTWCCLEDLPEAMNDRDW